MIIAMIMLHFKKRIASFYAQLIAKGINQCPVAADPA